MKNHHRLFAALMTFAVLASAAVAAEVSPAGTWKWTVHGGQGQGFEQTVKLDYRDGKLTGIMPGRDAGQFSVPDTPISDASFQEGEIKFSVTREFRGRKFTTRYEGKLSGNTINWTFETSGNAKKGPSKNEWIAKRVP